MIKSLTKLFMSNPKYAAKLRKFRDIFLAFVKYLQQENLFEKIADDRRQADQIGMKSGFACFHNKVSKRKVHMKIIEKELIKMFDNWFNCIYLVEFCGHPDPNEVVQEKPREEKKKEGLSHAYLTKNSKWLINEGKTPLVYKEYEESPFGKRSMSAGNVCYAKNYYNFMIPVAEKKPEIVKGCLFDEKK